MNLSAYDRILRMTAGDEICIEATYGLRWLVRYVITKEQSRFEVRLPWGVRAVYPIEKSGGSPEFVSRRIAASIMMQIGSVSLRETELPIELHLPNVVRAGPRYAAYHLPTNELVVYGDTPLDALEGYQDWLDVQRTLNRKEKRHAKKSQRKGTGANGSLRPKKAQQPQRRSHRKPAGGRRAAVSAADTGTAIPGEGETQRKSKQRRTDRPAQHPGADPGGTAGRPEQADVV